MLNEELQRIYHATLDILPDLHTRIDDSIPDAALNRLVDQMELGEDGIDDFPALMTLIVMYSIYEFKPAGQSYAEKFALNQMSEYQQGSPEALYLEHIEQVRAALLHVEHAEGSQCYELKALDLLTGERVHLLAESIPGITGDFMGGTYFTFLAPLDLEELFMAIYPPFPLMPESVEKVLAMVEKAGRGTKNAQGRIARVLVRSAILDAYQILCQED